MRRCPVNALEPFRILGLRYEYLVVGVVTFVLLHVWFRVAIGASGPFLALAIAIPTAMSLQKATEDQPGAWLQHVVLLWFCHPRRARYWPTAIQSICEQFMQRGVMPPADCKSIYEG